MLFRCFKSVIGAMNWVLDHIPSKGEVLSLTCAILWAVAVLFFRKAVERVPAFKLNFLKNWFVFLLFLPTAFLLDVFSLPDISTKEWGILFLSGFLGICMADFLFFKALKILGAGRNAIVDCSYSLFIILFSCLLLNETLGIIHFAGASLVVLGIVAVSMEGESKEDGGGSYSLRGVVLGLSSMALTAIAVVLVKPLMEKESISLVQVATLRLFAGIVGATVILGALGKLRETILTLRGDFPWLAFVVSGFIGGYVAMFIWLAGYKYTEASIAGVLNQTSTLFTVLLAAIFLKERLTLGKAVGSVLAFGGVAMIFLWA